MIYNYYNRKKQSSLIPLAIVLAIVFGVAVGHNLTSLADAYMEKVERQEAVLNNI